MTGIASGQRRLYIVQLKVSVALTPSLKNKTKSLLDCWPRLPARCILHSLVTFQMMRSQWVKPLPHNFGSRHAAMTSPGANDANSVSILCLDLVQLRNHPIYERIAADNRAL